MTGQNDRQDRSLTGQVRDQAGHCPLTGRYLQPWACKSKSKILNWYLRGAVKILLTKHCVEYQDVRTRTSLRLIPFSDKKKAQVGAAAFKNQLNLARVINSNELHFRPSPLTSNGIQY